MDYLYSRPHGKTVIGREEGGGVEGEREASPETRTEWSHPLESRFPFSGHVGSKIYERESTSPRNELMQFCDESL